FSASRTAAKYRFPRLMTPGKVPTVSVTGMAWTTPLGDDLDLVWNRLLAGETGLAPVPYSGRLRNGLAAMVASVPADLPAGERLHLMACQTARNAIAAADSDPGDPHTRLILGTSLGAYLDEEPARDSLYAWAERVGRE